MEHFNIWIADDDEDDFISLKLAFECANPAHSLTHFSAGLNLLAKLEEFKSQKDQMPDVIILDLNMPRITGLEILQKIRTNISYSNLPVFVHSTSKDKNQIDKCLVNGADGYFVKGNTLTKIQNTADSINERLKLNVLTQQ